MLGGSCCCYSPRLRLGETGGMHAITSPRTKKRMSVHCGLQVARLGPSVAQVGSQKLILHNSSLTTSILVDGLTMTLV